MAFLPLAYKPAPRDHLPMRIEIPLYPGFDEVDAIAPFEVLSNAEYAIEDLTVELVGAYGPGEVVAAHGARFLCAEGLTGAADLVLVPGGGWVRGGGVRDAYEDGRLAATLKTLHADGVAMASVCTGALLLAQAGITDGRPATTHRAALDALEERGALVDREARVVDDGDLLTCGGVTSGLDLAVHLVEREWGAELAGQIARLMEHEPVGPIRVVQAPPTAAPAASAPAPATR
jgi:transcriptional regulator GlxA family with amidase domain